MKSSVLLVTLTALSAQAATLNDSFSEQSGRMATRPESVVITSPAIRNVSIGEDLQTVLDSLVNTRTNVNVVLPLNYTCCNSPVVLRNRLFKTWITITGPNAFTDGVRVSPADAVKMPKLTIASSDPVIESDQSTPVGTQRPGAAHDYRFVGLEITTTAGLNWNLVALGIGNETVAAQLPYNIEIHHCYIHGAPTGEMVRGVSGNAANLTIADSYISGFKSTFMEANAFGLISSTGPFDFENNYFEAAAENVFFGGGGTDIPDMIPTGITIRHNYFYKPLAWRALSPAVYVKNLLEFKAGRNITVDGNVFENDWAQNQNGTAILFTPRTYYGTSPDNVVSNVTFTNNIVRHAVNGLEMGAYDDRHGPLTQFQLTRSSNITVRGNFFDDLSANKYADPSTFATGIIMVGPPAPVVVDSNTFHFYPGESRPSSGFWLAMYTELRGTTVTNNMFGTDVNGDARGGSTVVTYSMATPSNMNDPNYWLTSPVGAAPIFSATNAVIETNPAMQRAWSAAVPGIKFTDDGQTGANLPALLAGEAAIKLGTR